MRNVSNATLALPEAVGDDAATSLRRPLPVPAGPMLLSVLALITLSVPVAASLAGLRIDYPAWSASSTLMLLFSPALIAMILLRWQRGTSALFQFMASAWLTLPILLLSYAAARLAMPMADDRLLAMDRAIGIDVGALLSLAGQWPALCWLLGKTYASFGFQILFLGPLLVLLGQRRRGEMFLCAFALTTLLCIAVSIWFPSLGTFAHLGLGSDVTGAINPFFGHHFLKSFHAVRGDPAFMLAPGVASGIVTFPSIHAFTAVLCGWAAWSHAALRWPLMALNALMFLSAITNGAHYAVDTIAGGAVAVAVILLLSRFRDSAAASPQQAQP